jgi:hypothetical protein
MASSSSTRQGNGARPPAAAVPAAARRAPYEGGSEGRVGAVRQLPANAYQTVTRNPALVKSLVEQYLRAARRSQEAGGAVSFRVEVDPAGEATVFPVEAARAEPAVAPAPALQRALAAARERGRLLAAEVLNADDMVSADAFAAVLGTSRMTVNTKRQNGQLLGLDGTKRGFRFPLWQLDSHGKPFAELQALHEVLGGAWAVYRFMVQPLGELDGMTGREALARRRSQAVLRAAESVARDFG